jgi:hypothetical protein
MDENYGQTRKTNPGFRFGLIGGLILGFLFFIQIILKKNVFDIPIIIISIPVYFLLGRSAAMAQYEVQRESFESVGSVQSTGMGAALTAVVIVWLAIIIRAIIRDAMGVQILTDPVSLCLDFGASGGSATLMGSLGGKSVVKQYSSGED